MAAQSYYSHLPSNIDLSEPHRSPLKPLFLSGNHMIARDAEDQLQHVRKADEALKHRIRVLRVLSRLLATALSLAVLIPITLTLQKFLATQHTYRTVTLPTGATQTRTAWSLKTKAWPTYMYFSVALISFTMNLFTLLAYFWSVKAANKWSYWSTFFNVGILLSNLGVWIVAAALYRYEKSVTEEGKHNDLWGWTCSSAAQAIQHAFQDDVNFDKFCTIQSSSWYAGVVQVGAMILTLIIWMLAGRRKTTKKTVLRSSRELNSFGHY